MHEIDRHACKICTGPSPPVISLPNYHRVGPAALDILLCNRCGLLFVGNRFSTQDLFRAYEAVDSRAYYSQVATRTDEKAARVANNLAPLLRSRARGSVLDVGCGHGHVLEALRSSFSGLRLAGHELQEECARVCQEKGFLVFTGALDKIEQNFSVVTLLDVAEHLQDPVATFRDCRSLLEEKGFLYLHTPRHCFWDSLALRLLGVPGLGRFSALWLPSRLSVHHLQLWTERALRLCLEQAGFSVVYLRAETELSWPLRTHIQRRLGENCPRILVLLSTLIATVLFVWLGTLRNKAICLAVRS